MRRLPIPAAVLTAAVVPLLASHPAQAHGMASSGLFNGLVHPLLGLDHLLLLLAVASTAVLLRSQLLLWAGAGAVTGALLGLQGFSLPGGEPLAALMVAALGLLLLLPVIDKAAGPLVATAVASHAWLHGLEAPLGGSAVAWWAGALLASLAVVMAGCALLRQLRERASGWLPLLFIAAGLGLASVALLVQAGGSAA